MFSCVNLFFVLFLRRLSAFPTAISKLKSLCLIYIRDSKGIYCEIYYLFEIVGIKLLKVASPGIVQYDFK